MRWSKPFPLAIGALILCLAPGSSIAQAPSAKDQVDRTDTLRVAPNAPRSTPEVRSEQGGAVGPADICQELLSFMQKANAEASGPRPAAGAAASRAPGAASNNSPDTSQQQSGVSAPVPKADAGAAPAAQSLEQVQSLAGNHDLRGCQRLAQQMRRAGVPLPPGILALAALREDLLGETNQAPR